MSRGYYKTYGRKGIAPVTQASIQFDKLFCENSNRPSASKSAGIVGKWGITSFTSLRSSNFTIGRQDDTSYKRPHSETKSNKVYSPQPPPVVSPSQPRPKKFFKSRNTDGEAAVTTSAPAAAPPPIRKYSKPLQRSASVTSNKKTYVSQLADDEEEDENKEHNRQAIKLSSSVSSHTTSSTTNSHNPPIVLRIFKGTAQLLTEDSFHPKKENRRRSHSGEHNDNVSPKRHKSKIKDIESLRKDLEDEEPTMPSITKVTDEDPFVEEIQTVPSEIPEVNNDSAIETETNNLLESTYLDSQVTENNVFDAKPSTEDDEPEELLKVLEEDIKPVKIPEAPVVEPTAPFVEPIPMNVNTVNEEIEIEKEEEVVKEEETEKEPEKIEEPPLKEEPSSDSEGSEVIDRNSVIPEVKSEPEVPKVNTRPAKKGCIFKSRGASGEKRQAHYIHKWCDNKEMEGSGDKSEKAVQPTVPKVGGEFDPETLTRVINYHPNKSDLSDDFEPVTSVTCSKKAKEFYTVVRNVKKAHQIQESGEFQEFNDDVEYILDALQDNNPISTRCLSAISLASKCMVPAFRMHVRAHGTVTKFFKALHDATKDQRLGMCTATVMFVLSQDRLNMDVDRDSLELMLNLLESDTSHNSALDDCGLTDVQLQKTKERVRSLCQEIQEQGHGKHLNLDNITVGHLAMETLLSLTSRRAGEWFKEELRDLGGLEHIIRTVVDTCQPVNSSVIQWTPHLMDRLRKADRCLRVLENVTLHNEENNNYLLTYGDGILVDTVVRVFRVCDHHLTLYPATSSADKHSVGAVIRDCLMSILKVLINLTHDFNNKSFGSALAGKKQGVIEASLHVLLEIPEYVPEEQKFDFIVLALILLINLVEHCDGNRKLLIEAKAPCDPNSLFSDNSISAVSALVALFLQHEELARTEEKKTDAILDGEKPPESQQQKSQEEFIEETVAMLLQKAGRHMEHTLVGAYVAILLGYLTLENEEFELFVRNHMPDRNYTTMLSVLQKFYNFMTLTAAAGSVSSKGIKSTEMLIKHLTETDKALTCSAT